MGNVCVSQEHVRVQQGLPTCRPARGCLRPLAEKQVQGIPGLIGPNYSDTGKMELRGQGCLCFLLGSFLFLSLRWLRSHQTLRSPKWAESRRACKAKGLSYFF